MANHEEPKPSTSQDYVQEQNGSHQTLLDQLQSSTDYFDKKAGSNQQNEGSLRPVFQDVDEWDEDEFFTSSPPLSPSSETYRQKLGYLKEKFNLIQENTDRLRSRLYNIKKEISNMKKLKRVLINKLITYGDDFYSHPLEIPDDRIETPLTAAQPLASAPLPKKRKAAAMPKKEFGQPAAKRKSIVEETIAEMKAAESYTQPPLTAPLESPHPQTSR